MTKAVRLGWVALLLATGCSLTLFSDDPTPGDGSVEADGDGGGDGDIGADADADGEEGGEAGECNAETCPDGCCSDGWCAQGTSSTACGTGGVACDECLPGQVCAADTRTCAGLTTCGDGEMDPGEECDDGDDNSDTTPDACRTDCHRASCGDEVTDTGETCDDGNTTAGDGCSPGCTTEGECGNGTTETGEDCDDGNTDPGDGCDGTCHWEAVCGNNEPEPGEECDDGNTDPNDGCGPSCLVERCGDGFLRDGEGCDDGNTDPNDGCNEACQTEFCGDGVQQTSEACDDGNPADNDACPTNCQPATCGDGYVRTDGSGLDEECDDGASNSDTEPNACRTDCRSARCGDGVTDTGETCDDGNTDVGDGCSATCGLESCGNGTTDPGEECDDGNTVNFDACTNNCTDAVCGDGIVWVGTEDCDTSTPRTCGTSCGTAGTQECVSCIWAASCTPPVETCDGRDENCDTVADDGYACAQGRTTSCATSCGTTGSGPCTETCSAPTGAACTPPTEECNGLDDDCNGSTDEGFECRLGATVSCTTTCDTTGTGTCMAGCLIPNWMATCNPPAETCNSVDDDCDGNTDETFTCTPGQVGSCSTTCGSLGTWTCNAACRWPTGGAACTPPGEACNGVDDDCDGQTDETSACTPGTTVTCSTWCGTTGSGTCESTCEIPDLFECTPPAEVCNTIDDNCNGVTNEGFDCSPGATGSCTATCGSLGTRACNATTCRWSTCTPPAETCNGADDDCDGTTDDGFTCPALSSRTCTTTCGTTGTQLCNVTCAWNDCEREEMCNRVDDNCDGLTDEGFTCIPETVEDCTTTCGSDGTRQCDWFCRWGTCQNPTEICNGSDDDCDGLFDEDFACRLLTTRTCTTSCGSTGTQTCGPGCTWNVCNAPTEVCNLIDDDCDSKTDEGLWCVASTPVTTDLMGVFAFGVNDAWLVGTNGQILHFVGDRFLSTASGVTSHLQDVYGFWRTWTPPLPDTQELWAVGDGGVILKWTTSSPNWTVVSPAPTSRHLRGIWGTSFSQIFAVGTGGTILSYDGSSWTTQTSGTSNDLWDVFGFSPIDAWAVGASGTAQQRSGAAWINKPTGSTTTLAGVYGTRTDSVVAVGNGGDGRFWNGTGWAASATGTTQNLTDAWLGATGFGTLAVGYGGTLRQYNIAAGTWDAVTGFPTVGFSLYSIHTEPSRTRTFIAASAGRMIYYTRP